MSRLLGSGSARLWTAGFNRLPAQRPGRQITSGRAARRTVTVYGRKITGAYGVLPTVYGTAELRQMALTVRYGGFTAGNGATARIRVKTLCFNEMTRILRHSRQYDNTYDAEQLT